MHVTTNADSKESKSRVGFKKPPTKANYLLFINDPKQGKDVSLVSPLVDTVYTFGDDIKIEFEFKKGGVLEM